LAPSMHWPVPLLSHDVEPDRGPVLVTIEYAVAAVDRAAFLTAMAKLSDGAYDWGIYEDASKEGVFVETFCVDSCLDHMRQHQRVTNADRGAAGRGAPFSSRRRPRRQAPDRGKRERTGMIAYGLPIARLCHAIVFLYSRTDKLCH